MIHVRNSGRANKTSAQQEIKNKEKNTPLTLTLTVVSAHYRVLKPKFDKHLSCTDDSAIHTENLDSPNG